MSSLSVFLLALATLPQGSVAPSCETVSQALRGRACVVAGSAGLAIAPDASRAEKLAEMAGAGEAAWRANFGAEPARYVVFESGTPPETARDRAAFVQAGFPVALPWASPSAWIAAEKRMVETQIRGQLGAMVGEQQATEVVARVHATLDAGATPEATAAREAAGLPHDLGHHWFTAALWPSQRSGPEHAGGPGPDWLDEAAAQLAEPEAAAARKRDMFRETYAGAATDVSLDAVLAGPPAGGVVRMNPGAGAPRRVPAGTQVMSLGGAPGAQVSPPPGGPSGAANRVFIGGPGGPGGPGGAVPAMGVPQAALTRVFLDYLAVKSAGKPALPSLASAIANGGDLDQWLAAEGAGFGLPGTTQALEADWRTWIAEAYPTSS